MLRLSRRRASEAFSPLGLDLGASRPPDLRRGLSGTSATRGSPSAWRSPGPLRAGYPGVLSATSSVMLPLASPTGNTVGLSVVAFNLEHEHASRAVSLFKRDSVCSYAFACNGSGPDDHRKHRIPGPDEPELRHIMADSRES